MKALAYKKFLRGLFGGRWSETSRVYEIDDSDDEVEAHDQNVIVLDE